LIGEGQYDIGDGGCGFEPIIWKHVHLLSKAVIIGDRGDVVNDEADNKDNYADNSQQREELESFYLFDQSEGRFHECDDDGYHVLTEIKFAQQLLIGDEIFQYVFADGPLEDDYFSDTCMGELLHMPRLFRKIKTDPIDLATL
jgi:hypothetical protein